MLAWWLGNNAPAVDGNEHLLCGPDPENGSCMVEQEQLPTAHKFFLDRPNEGYISVPISETDSHSGHVLLFLGPSLDRMVVVARTRNRTVSAVRATASPTRHRWQSAPLPWSHTRPTHNPGFETRQCARSRRGALVAHLDIACTAIQIEMQVFYFTKLGKLVGDILFGCLFMHVCDQDDPAFDSCAIRISGGCERALW